MKGDAVQTLAGAPIQFGKDTMERTSSSQPREADASFHMIDVSGKESRRRRAVAQGKAYLPGAAFEALRDGTNPKGNVLALAEVAGIQAAKRTADLIPLCHPLPLQSVRFQFILDESESSVLVTCETIACAQTGVEMEALSGVSGALLSIYDLSKAVAPAITLGEIRLNLKEGGKSGVWSHPEEAPCGPSASREPGLLPLEGQRVAILTVSDRVFQGAAEDRSGPALQEIIRNWGGVIAGQGVVADDRREIQLAIRRAISEGDARLVITTGGTGLSPRDVTPEAILELADRVVPGIGEALRRDGSRKIATAWLSRSVGALIGSTLVVSLPGSPKAVAEGMEVLRPLLSHGIHISRGGDHGSIR